MSTVDLWSKHSWKWASKPQRDYLKEIEPHYRSAIALGSVEAFWTAFRETWAYQYPVVPGLVARGELPPEALKDGFTLGDEQLELVEAMGLAEFEV